MRYIFLILVFFASHAFSFDRIPLNAKQLKKLVIGNTMIGSTCHSRSTYLLYFFKDGRLYFEKNNLPKETYLGYWKVKGHEIMSRWPTYRRKGWNILRYYHMGSNVYVPYNVNNACGPAGTFGYPFIVIKGIYRLDKVKHHDELKVLNGSV